MNTWTLLPVDSWQHVLYAALGFAHSLALVVLVHLQCAKKKKKAGQPADTKQAPAKAPKPGDKPAPSVDKEKTADATGDWTLVEDPDLKSKSDYIIITEPEGSTSAMAKGDCVFVDQDGNLI